MDQRFDYVPLIKLNRLPTNPDEAAISDTLGVGRFPKWLHRKIPQGKNLAETNAILKKHGLNTVCEEAKCPNRLECYSKKTATFLVLGKECTRACGFCDIDFNKAPAMPDKEEPYKLAMSVKDLGLTHVVITMVARDDLSDGGANHLAAILRAIKEHHPSCTIEILTSDFAGNLEALSLVLDEEPEIFNYNIETTRRLTPKVRHTATYERTLQTLSFARSYKKNILIKSGIMVGLGETKEEMFETIEDLKNAGCDIITIGQYLQASAKKLKVTSFVPLEDFKEYEKFGNEIGVKHVYAGPFVRSSYNAKEILKQSFNDYVSR